MRDRAPEGSLRRALWVGVNPLLVAGGIGKTVNLLLGYLIQSVVPSSLADQLEQVGRLF